jgi:hypothetical protein
LRHRLCYNVSTRGFCASNADEAGFKFMRECLVCKKLFKDKLNQKYCSSKCFGVAHTVRVEKKCLNCSKVILCRPHRVKSRKHIFCSYKCHGAFFSGTRNNKWNGDKINYGSLHDWVSSKLGSPTICEHCGKTGLTGKQINWANKDHAYKRNLTDWLRLCSKCHLVYDLKNNLRKHPKGWNKGTKGMMPEPWNKGMKSKKYRNCLFCNTQFYPYADRNYWCSKSCATKSRQTDSLGRLIISG